MTIDTLNLVETVIMLIAASIGVNSKILFVTCVFPGLSDYLGFSHKVLNGKVKIINLEAFYWNQ